MAYEAHKRSYLGTAADCAAQGLAFLPMVGEPSGGWGPSAICTLKAIARAKAARCDLDPSQILSLELQQLSTAVRRANARAVLRRDCGVPPGGDHASLEAVAVLAAAGDDSGET